MSGYQQTTSERVLHPQVLRRPHRLTRTARAHSSGDAWNRLPTRTIETQRNYPQSYLRRRQRGGTLRKSTLGRGKLKPGKNFVCPSNLTASSLSLGSSRAFGTNRSSHRLPVGTSLRTRSQTGRVKTSLGMDARWTSSRVQSTEKTREASFGCVTGVLSIWPMARHGRCIWYGSG